MTVAARRWRIAIVDDSLDDRAEIKALLLRGSDRRYDFVEAVTGEAGLEICRSEPAPDCLILDYHLPDMNAMEILRALPRAPIGERSVPALPVVVLTGSVTGQAGRAMLQAGAQDFIGKEWTTADSLTHAVENAVERHAMEMGLARAAASLAERESEREDLLAAERAARAESERVARIKDEFLATLSHELRTPLNAIVGWAQLLQRLGGDPKIVQEGIEVIARNANAQAQLIADLLDMNRIVSGKLKMEVDLVHPNLVASAAADTVRPAAEAKGVRLDLRLGQGLAQVRGDAGRLQQVLWNLLTNAVKFTPAGGTVGLSISGSDDAVRFVVEDTGQGIDPDFMPHLFDRFSQADNSAARRHGGLGLGLSIVRQLVELHAGTVAAESEGPGRGSRFVVTLPAAERTGPVAALPDSAALAGAPGTADAARLDFSDPSLRGLSVLLVDDQADALEFARRLLVESGASVATAGSAAEALEHLRRHRPDVLVSDIGMPELDGYGLIREIREGLHLGPRDLPAAALTAFARSEDLDRVLAAGFQAHISKPLRPQLLLTTVAALARGEPIERTR